MRAYIFKTIYFPGTKVASGQSTRVTVSVPTVGNADTPEPFLAYLRGLSSRDFRLALGDPDLTALEARAQSEGRSFSSLCLRLLMQSFERNLAVDQSGQLTLPLPDYCEDIPPQGEATQPKSDIDVTFKDSLRQHIHGWYPYVEGFSASYTRDAICRYRPRTVFDPFGGAGTTMLAAASMGLPSFYAEVNPFMAFVADTKVNATRWAHNNYAEFEDASRRYLAGLTREHLERVGRTIDLSSYEDAFPERDFFVERDIRHLLAAREIGREIAGDRPELAALFMLACASNAVRASNMTRRADLRRRRADEYKTRVVDVAAFVQETVVRMIDDVPMLPPNCAYATKVADDCRDVPTQFNSAFDLALTSPPYLNGTNYFRNTKIELWLSGLIDKEDDLRQYRLRAVCAGINNVSKSRPRYTEFESVEKVGRALDGVAGDARIPLLIRHYFSDMLEVLKTVHRVLKPNGAFLLDIGDSKFYGIHVPTDHLLVEVAESAGFMLEQRNVLARRHSRDKSELTQVELVLRKSSSATRAKAPKREVPPIAKVHDGPSSPEGRHDGERVSITKPKRSTSALKARIESFSGTLPYKTLPFSKRNWGHDLHSLCSYQGKLKPAIAHWLIREFVPPGGSVLDPLGGVGTIPFEAALQGGHAVSNDKSPFAALVAAAKLDPPTPLELHDAIASIEQRMKHAHPEDRDYASASFGLNGKVQDYFHERTLDEILRARRVFRESDVLVKGESFAWASLLHVLHGNRPYAVSRTSHPITPFHPSGEAVYKRLLDHVRTRAERALAAELPATFRRGTGLHGDFRDLPRRNLPLFDAIITSPPFLGMRFDRPNWLRMWFCGWEEDDFHTRSLNFLERQQTKDVGCYSEFFQTCRTIMKGNALLVVHIGSGGAGDLAGDLRRLADDQFVLEGEVVENVQGVEQHGIRDKGLTTQHHLLFLRPR